METLRYSDLPPDWEAALAAAVEVREKAYAPYSGFHVGACVLGPEGELFSGANVENASYGLSLCAERSAAVAAVSAGLRSFSLVAVTAWHAQSTGADAPVSPCGACRQFLYEFKPKRAEMKLLMADAELNVIRLATLDELLPEAFTL